MDGAAARILVIDDDSKITDVVRRGLAYQGYRVDVAHGGAEGLESAQQWAPDVVILDILMPGLDGLEVCRRLRTGGDVPILLLTARDSVEDRVLGLETGADDYLVKPFSYVVLLARLRAMVRRGREPRPAVLRSGRLELDPATRSVSLAGAPVALSPREFRLLEHLMRREGASVTKTELLEHVFDVGADGGPNLVEVYVGYLRRKLGRDAVLTVPGSGYRVAT